MKPYRYILFFFSVLFLSILLAVSAVAWSFYESLQNALKQEGYLADHRARDLVLSLAKSAETRLQTDGYMELDKLFQRYVSESKKDPEKFQIEEISLYNPEGLLLVSNRIEFHPEDLKLRKPDTEFAQSTFFQKGLRMKKWEWAEIENGENPLPGSHQDPEIRSAFRWVLRYIPLAQKNKVRITTPLYAPGTLNVSGLVYLVYNRGNMALLLENQWQLLEWMSINYMLLAFLLSSLVTVLFILLSIYKESQEKSQTEVLPLVEKKTVVSDQTADNTQPLEQVTSESSSEKVLDAIYLG